MRFMKLLAIMLAVSIVLSLTASAYADTILIDPSSGPVGTHVVVTTGEDFILGDSSCTVSSKPSGLISNPTCVLSPIDLGQRASASFTVACAPAGDYTVILTGNPSENQVSTSFSNEGGSCPVGGVVLPVNTLVLVSPWLAVIGIVGCISTVVVVAKKRHP